MASVLFIFCVVCVVLLCTFAFGVPCCDVRYDFRMKAMFGLYLPPVVCRRAHSLFTLFVFVWVWWSPTHVPYVASFSGLSFFDCPFGVLGSNNNSKHPNHISVVTLSVMIDPLPKQLEFHRNCHIISLHFYKQYILDSIVVVSCIIWFTHWTLVLLFLV